MKRMIGFVHRVVYASLISLVGVIVCVLPNIDVGAVPCKALNWPVSVLGQFIPGWAGVNVVSARGGCDFCTPAERLQSHLALAIPVYVTLFYIPNLIAWILRQRRQKRERLLMTRESANGG